MKCHNCGALVIERKVGATNPYRFVGSGLPHVFLVGIRWRACTSCKTEGPVIPRLGELLEFIAHLLLDKKGRLTGPELRYLRKHVGLSAVDCAGLILIDPATLSRVEAGKQDLGASTDKLSRAIVLAEIAREEQEENLSAFLLRRQRPSAAEGRRITRLRYRKNRWQEDKAA